MNLNGIKEVVLVLFSAILVTVPVIGQEMDTAKINSLSVEQRAKSLLDQMTLEEKIDYIGGYKSFYIRGIERLDIPQIVMADGPVGCRNYGKTTAYPAAIGLAASWNRQLAGQFGTAIGRDCRARGVHILLMPGVNIYRSPLCGRNFEYMGEDPYLTSQIAVSVVKAVQAQGVMATVKHYAGNNQEYDRHNISSDIDERTLQEIYLQAFKHVVQDAKVGAVMTAYNLVNGIHCSQNNYLNNTILKGQWGFDGIVMSDWTSTYDAIAAANGGLDIEMPDAKYMNKENLMPAIESGQVKIATIDDKVLRILRTLIRMGFFDRTQKDVNIPLEDPSSAKVALQEAREGIVLLKNTDNTLPLNRDEIKSIALLGPNASMKYNAHGGGGSSFTKPFKVVSVVDAVKALSDGKFEVLTAEERDDSKPSFDFNDFEIVGDGFNCKIYEYKEEYREKEPAGIKPISQKQCDRISFSAKEKNFENAEKFFTSAWQGTIKPKKDGIYRMHAEIKGRLRYVFLDEEMVLKDSGGEKEADLFLKKDKTYNLKFYYVVYPSEKDKWVFRIGCEFIADFDSYADVETMKKADAVVVCVGFNPEMEFEGGDRAYRFPLLQEMLIKRAAEVNKKTIVVATAGGSFATENWIKDIKALIHNWYPGQNGATALAEIIFGQTNPSGKLPITFEKRLEDRPSYNSYHDTDGDKHVKYSEGIFIGYRGYEKNDVKPLFCFGHGLSYTQFEYSNLEITPAQIKTGETITVSLDVKNTGKINGAEVVQLYIGDSNCSLPRPPKELKRFEKIYLKAGEQKTVEFVIGDDELSFYSVENKKWVAEPGEFKISIGSSSADIRLAGIFELQ